MKKSLIALAVASAVAAPAAFAATANVDVYGQLTLSYDYINTDSSLAGEDKKLTRVSSNSSRIGFKGSEDLGGGLAAIWQIESQLNMDNGTNNLGAASSTAAGSAFASGTGPLEAGSFTSGLRNTFVGLKSATLGTALLGKHDTPFKLATARLDIFADTAGDFNNIVGNFSGGNLFDLRPGNVAAYITPNFSGLSGAVAYVAGNEVGNDSATATGANANAWSLMGMYDQGPIFASLAYEKHNNVNGGVVAPNSAFDNSAWKLGLGYKFGDAKVGFVYEDMQIAKGLINNPGRSAWYLNGAYTLGAVELKAAYGRASDIDNNGTAKEGANTYVLGADYNLSKRSKLYALYAKVNNDKDGTYGIGAGQGSSYVPGNTGLAGTSGLEGNDPSVFSVGVRHSF